MNKAKQSQRKRRPQQARQTRRYIVRNGQKMVKAETKFEIQLAKRLGYKDGFLPIDEIERLGVTRVATNQYEEKGRYEYKDEKDLELHSKAKRAPVNAHDSLHVKFEPDESKGEDEVSPVAEVLDNKTW